jgi:hypothetical protein
MPPGFMAESGRRGLKGMADDTGSSAFELRDSDCVAQFPLLL